VKSDEMILSKMNKAHRAKFLFLYIFIRVRVKMFIDLSSVAAPKEITWYTCVCMCAHACTRACNAR